MLGKGKFVFGDAIFQIMQKIVADIFGFHAFAVDDPFFVEHGRIRFAGVGAHGFPLCVHLYRFFIRVFNRSQVWRMVGHYCFVCSRQYIKLLSARPGIYKRH